MVWRLRCLYLSGFILSIAGCSSTPDSVPVTRTDSAGVEVTYSQRSLWTSGDEWTVESAPSLDIGRDHGDSTQLLSIVMGVQPLSDGSLVVQDNGTYRLLVFDSTGRRRRTIGRQGRGPGEFEGMWGTYRCGGDTLVVDQGHSIGVFAPDGEFVVRQRIERPPGATSNGIQGVTNDCASVLLYDREQVEPQSGVFAGSAVLWWWRRYQQRWDTVHRFSGPELSRLTIHGRAVAALVPFGRQPVWAHASDRVYFGFGDRPEIQVFGPTGRLERVIRWEAELSPVTDADRAAYDARRQSYLERHPEEAIVYRPLSDYPVPRHKPSYARAQVDDVGRLWVLQYPVAAGGLPHVERDELTTEAERWWVFGQDDAWYGTVTMPPGFALRRIDGDRLVGIYIDASAVEHVQVYRLVRSD